MPSSPAQAQPSVAQLFEVTENFPHPCQPAPAQPRSQHGKQGAKHNTQICSELLKTVAQIFSATEPLTSFSLSPNPKPLTLNPKSLTSFSISPNPEPKKSRTRIPKLVEADHLSSQRPPSQRRREQDRLLGLGMFRGSGFRGFRLLGVQGLV